MKKMLTLFIAAFAALAVIGLQCEEPPPDKGDVSIELLGDSIKTDTMGVLVEYQFDLANHTEADLDVSLDIPEARRELPDVYWSASLCSDEYCYPFLPLDTSIVVNGALENWHVTISAGHGATGTEGKVVFTVTAGQETDEQIFILQLAE